MDNDGSCRITCRAANEETIATAAQDKLLDQLNDQSHPCRPLRMAENERGTVVVKRVEIEGELACQVDIVHCKRIVRLDSLYISNADPRSTESLARRRYRRLGHEASFGACLSKGDHLDLDGRVPAQFLCACTRGQHHPTVAIGGMGLGAIRDGPTFLHRAQPGQSLLRCGIDPLVISHGRYDLAPGGVLHLDGADHVTMVESSSVLEGVLVLLVAHVRYCVLLFQGDSVLRCDVLCRLEHGIAGIG